MFRKLASCLAVAATALVMGSAARADTPNNWHLISHPYYGLKTCMIDVSGIQMGDTQRFQLVVFPKNSAKVTCYSFAMPDADVVGNTITLSGNAKFKGAPALFKIVATTGVNATIAISIYSLDGKLLASDSGKANGPKDLWIAGWD